MPAPNLHAVWANRPEGLVVVQVPQLPVRAGCDQRPVPLIGVILILIGLEQPAAVVAAIDDDSPGPDQMAGAEDLKGDIQHNAVVGNQEPVH